LKLQLILRDSIMQDLSKEPDLGYVFYPYDGIEHPGHPRMDVIIHKTPTLRHFDPEEACYLIATHKGHKLEHIHISHPWTQAKKYQVCAGRIMVSDRKGKRVEAFSFGGDLQISVDDRETVCVLKSPAPIFYLGQVRCLPTWLTSEAEIILARQKAHGDAIHRNFFEEHLAQVDPFLLYASSLRAMQDRPCDCYLEEDELEHECGRFIRSEIERLRENDRWPLHVPKPDELFHLKAEKK
jgi:hypothetical protein